MRKQISVIFTPDRLAVLFSLPKDFRCALLPFAGREGTGKAEERVVDRAKLSSARIPFAWNPTFVHLADDSPFPACGGA